MIFGAVAAAVGKGLFAGLAGTAAMTLSQQIEMKLSGREPSTGPGDMVADLLASATRRHTLSSAMPFPDNTTCRQALPEGTNE